MRDSEPTCLSVPRVTWPYLVIGVCAGLLSTVFGVGGGLVLVPLLTIFLRVPVKVAVGVSLATIIVVASVGVIAETRLNPGNVYWDVAGLLFAGSMLGAPLGAWLAARLPSFWLKKTFALLAIGCGLRILLSTGPADGGPLALFEDLARDIPTLMGIGFLAGTGSALFGIGGGAVVIPAMTLLYADFGGVEFVHARATSLAFIAPTAILGALLHRRLGHVSAYAVVRIVPLATMGGIFGVWLAGEVDGAMLRRAYGAFLVVMVLRLLAERPARAASAHGDSVPAE